MGLGTQSSLLLISRGGSEISARRHVGEIANRLTRRHEGMLDRFPEDGMEKGECSFRYRYFR